ncbi:MAG: hypothetical protein IPM12_11395 [Flavobacteriales bacterium]|nr:hypothetical protein [Flavobacteriales bacterium]
MSALTYNYLFAHNRRDKCILVTAEGAMFGEAVLIDLFAHLSQHNGQLRTPLATYEVAIEGVVDAQRLHAVTAHYFWISSLFERHLRRNNERFLLN